MSNTIYRTQVIDRLTGSASSQVILVEVVSPTVIRRVDGFWAEPPTFTLRSTGEFVRKGESNMGLRIKLTAALADALLEAEEVAR
jgi:hypothetical protein